MEKNKIQYKLLSLLPEIFRTEIYKQYTETIEGYAWKFAQIPSSVVQKTLKLEKHLQNKPLLKAAISQVGVHKVAILATIPESDEVLADKVIHMSKPALQELSKELRARACDNSTECRAVPTTITIQLDPEMTTLFLKLKKKYPNQNNQEVMKKILEKANENISHKPTEKGVVLQTKNTPKPNPSPGMKITKAPAAASRYINKHTKQQALIKSNHKCSYPNCNKPPSVFHHPDRFAKTKTHTNIRPLCKTHHEFAHNNLIQNETQPPTNWKLQFATVSNPIDLLYRKYKQAGGYE